MVQQKRRNEDREEEDRLAKKLFGSSAGFPDGFEDNSDDDVEIEGTFGAEVCLCVYWVTGARIKMFSNLGDKFN